MKITKAILTGGGRATRLQPVTTTTNKHLLPLAGKPMIFHAIEKVVAAGVTDIFINTNPGETQLQQCIGDGGHWGVNITFFEQTGGPQGIAHVVNEAKQFIGDDPFMFYLSDNILLGSVKDLADEFASQRYDAMIALSQVTDPQRFGVPVFDAAGTLIDVVEKPANPPSNFAVTGIYLFGPKVFFDAFAHIEKSARGEYEIPSIHSYLLRTGRSIGYKEITGWWKDTGKIEDLLLASTLLLDQMPETEFRNVGAVVSDVKVNGRAHIGAGAVIGAGSVITGPVFIGENVRLENAAVGPYVTLGAGVTVTGATIKNSILLENSTIAGGFDISNSLLGKSVSLKTSAPLAQSQLLLGDKTIVHF